MLLGSGAQGQKAWQAGRATAGAAVTKRHRCNFVAPFALLFLFFLLASFFCVFVAASLYAFLALLRYQCSNQKF